MSDKKKIDKTLGDKIYDLRTSGNYSQEYVGRLAGVSRQTVSKWESNSAQPKYENLKQLCNALDIDVSIIMSDEEVVFNKSDNKTATESEVVCDELTNSKPQEVKLDRVDEIQVQEEPNKPDKNKRKLSKKSKIIIASVVIAVVLLVGVVMIFINNFVASSNSGDFDRVEETVVWNMNIDTIGWIIFGVALIAALIIGIILLCKKLKARKNKKEEVAESHIN